MSTRKISAIVVSAVAVALILVGTAQAGFIYNYAEVTGDSDCGISSAFDYTCAVSLNDSVSDTVNGVAFAAPGAGYSYPSPTGAGYAVTGSLGGVSDYWSCSVGGNIGNVIKTAYWYNVDSTPVAVEFTGLTAGDTYLATFFTLVKGTGRSVFITNDVNDDSDTWNQGTLADGCGKKVTITYTAPSDGTIKFTFSKDTDHPILSGFANQVVPEPSTLALLAAGLVGLLAYAWRKRK